MTSPITLTPPGDPTAPRGASPPPLAEARPPIDAVALRARLRNASDDFFVLYTARHPPRPLGD